MRPKAALVNRKPESAVRGTLRQTPVSRTRARVRRLCPPAPVVRRWHVGTCVGSERVPLVSRVRSVVADQDDIAILDHIVLGLLTHQVVGFDFPFAAKPHQVVDLHRLGADESLGQIGVDIVGCLEGRASDCGSSRCEPLSHRR